MQVPARDALAKYMSAEKSRTQVWLGKVLGVSQSTVSLWVRGGPRPSIAQAIALQYLTGIPVDLWLTENERKLVGSVSVEAHRVMEERAKEQARQTAQAVLDPRQMPLFDPATQEAVTEIPIEHAMAMLGSLADEAPGGDRAAGE